MKWTYALFTILIKKDRCLHTARFGSDTTPFKVIWPIPSVYLRHPHSHFAFLRSVLFFFSIQVKESQNVKPHLSRSNPAIVKLAYLVSGASSLLVVAFQAHSGCRAGLIWAVLLAGISPVITLAIQAAGFWKPPGSGFLNKLAAAIATTIDKEKEPTFLPAVSVWQQVSDALMTVTSQHFPNYCHCILKILNTWENLNQGNEARLQGGGLNWPGKTCLVIYSMYHNQHTFGLICKFRCF